MKLFQRSRRAASGAEYAILIALVAFVAVSAVNGFGQQVSSLFGDAANGLSEAASGGAPSWSPGTPPLGEQFVLTYDWAPSAAVPISGRTIALYAATNLPPGLSMNSSTGVVSGTPTTPGAYASISATVTDSAGASTTIAFPTITIARYTSPPSIFNPPSGTAGTPVSEAWSSYAYAPTDPQVTLVSYAASGLPPGVSISSTTGALSGTPTTSGDYNFRVSVTDSLGYVTPFGAVVDFHIN